MFRDMFDMEPKTYMLKDEAISLDYPSSAIAVFLDAATSSLSLDYTTLSFGALHIYRKLVDHLVCDRIMPSVQNAYRIACRDFPRWWLSISSLENDHESATKALLQCSVNEPGEILQASATDFAWTLRSEWRFTFLSCLLAAPSDTRTSGVLHRWNCHGQMLGGLRNSRRMYTVLYSKRGRLESP